jgi:hypothetical protein
MDNVNGHEPGTSLDVIDVQEQAPIAAYLEAAQQTRNRIVDELRGLRDSEQRWSMSSRGRRARHAPASRTINAHSTRSARASAQRQPSRS